MQKLFFTLLCSLSLLTLFAQTKIEGKVFPNTLTTDKGELVLNGGGVREKLWIDVYVIALYLEAKSSNAADIVNGDKPMAVRLHIVSGAVTSEKMTSAIKEGFGRSTGGNMAPIQDKIDGFTKVFNEPIKVDDIFKLVYIPGEGVKVYKNETYKATTAGLDFKKALFGIWLGSPPADDDLKEEMLGIDD